LIRKIDLQDTRRTLFATRELKDVGLASFIRDFYFDRNWKSLVFMTVSGHTLHRSAESWTLLLGPNSTVLRSRLARIPRSLQFFGPKVVVTTDEGLRDLADLIHNFLMPNEAMPQENAG